MKTINAILLFLAISLTACSQPYVEWWRITGNDYFAPCDAEVNYTGGEDYPTTVEIDLGSATGYVYIDFNTYQIPDQFYVYYNGEMMWGSAYRGELSYGYDLNGNEPGYYRPQFINSLVGKTDPQWGTTYPDFAHYPWDGYPNVYLPTQARSYVMLKSNPSPTTITVEVYAPMGNTGWEFYVECPQ